MNAYLSIETYFYTHTYIYIYFENFYIHLCKIGMIFKK